MQLPRVQGHGRVGRAHVRLRRELLRRGLAGVHPRGQGRGRGPRRPVHVRRHPRLPVEHRRLHDQRRRVAHGLRGPVRAGRPRLPGRSRRPLHGRRHELQDAVHGVQPAVLRRQRPRHARRPRGVPGLRVLLDQVGRVRDVAQRPHVPAPRGRPRRDARHGRLPQVQGRARRRELRGRGTRLQHLRSFHGGGSHVRERHGRPRGAHGLRRGRLGPVRGRHRAHRRGDGRAQGHRLVRRRGPRRPLGHGRQGRHDRRVGRVRRHVHRRRHDDHELQRRGRRPLAARRLRHGHDRRGRGQVGAGLADVDGERARDERVHRRGRRRRLRGGLLVRRQRGGRRGRQGAAGRLPRGPGQARRRDGRAGLGQGLRGPGPLQPRRGPRRRALPLGQDAPVGRRRRGPQDRLRARERLRHRRARGQGRRLPVGAHRRGRAAVDVVHGRRRVRRRRAAPVRRARRRDAQVRGRGLARLGLAVRGLRRRRDGRGDARVRRRRVPGRDVVPGRPDVRRARLGGRVPGVRRADVRLLQRRRRDVVRRQVPHGLGCASLGHDDPQRRGPRRHGRHGPRGRLRRRRLRHGEAAQLRRQPHVARGARRGDGQGRLALDGRRALRVVARVRRRRRRKRQPPHRRLHRVSYLDVGRPDGRAQRGRHGPRGLRAHGRVVGRQDRPGLRRELHEPHGDDDRRVRLVLRRQHLLRRRRDRRQDEPRHVLPGLRRVEPQGLRRRPDGRQRPLLDRRQVYRKRCPVHLHAALLGPDPVGLPLLQPGGGVERLVRAGRLQRGPVPEPAERLRARQRQPVADARRRRRAVADGRARRPRDAQQAAHDDAGRNDAQAHGAQGQVRRRRGHGPRARHRGRRDPRRPRALDREPSHRAL
mmetsp:Transcript_17678/g.54380  ORF Transcript_17678/g.54380 Transcript_17678/m.54380 type:complete len:872 (-) Transcript_17678:93-2708(-)